ncbi:hypothetical protein K461DRAFT_281297 [Myriangium duriaei CBS 260.36]|uniref:Uncharacterized protein n=1 Tax=Myriangium duriaei CBS 260.36 TaxID=1168546 RepID=A0A9P4IU55_9PEZI|nr:hypothetical protein K461DRAFT_281297 [Myriangium duriaei CBS 260.36]
MYEAARVGSHDIIATLRAGGCISWSDDVLKKAAEVAAEHGNVHAFLQLRRDGQSAPMSRMWLSRVASLRFGSGAGERQRWEAQVKFILGPESISDKDAVADQMLWYAGFYGCSDIAIDMIKKRGADVDYENQDKTTALWQAASEGHWDTIIQLLSRGANPLVQNIVPSDIGERSNLGGPSLDKLGVSRTPFKLASDVHGPGKPGSPHEAAMIVLKQATQSRRDSIFQREELLSDGPTRSTSAAYVHSEDMVGMVGIAGTIGMADERFSSSQPSSSVVPISTPEDNEKHTSHQMPSPSPSPPLVTLKEERYLHEYL